MQFFELMPQMPEKSHWIRFRGLYHTFFQWMLKCWKILTLQKYRIESFPTSSVQNETVWHDNSPQSNVIFVAPWCEKCTGKTKVDYRRISNGKRRWSNEKPSCIWSCKREKRVRNAKFNKISGSRLQSFIC